MYDNSTAFVTIPSDLGGCVGSVPGGIIGGIIGLPFGDPKAGAYVGASVFDTAFEAIIGAPFYVIEFIPRKIYEASTDDDEQPAIEKTIETIGE
uniref:hypothetical protein n=1 Tax=Thaumasiovibrio occultus TaxID=1891184 RepID=UPI000B34DC16|nr:hypothetical protein [Thaumasiovibrio occultus]